MNTYIKNKIKNSPWPPPQGPSPGTPPGAREPPGGPRGPIPRGPTPGAPWAPGTPI